MTDKDSMRAAFERCTESYYEGDFTKYDGNNSDYVSEQQQDDFMMFCSGFQAGAAYQAAQPVQVSEEDMVRLTDVMANGWDYGTHPRKKVEIFLAALAAINKPD